MKYRYSKEEALAARDWWVSLDFTSRAYVWVNRDPTGPRFRQFAALVEHFEVDVYSGMASRRCARCNRSLMDAHARDKCLFGAGVFRWTGDA